ncbi:MAG: type II toxin-antitoxin system VapB family antitoxin [Pseudonocardia sp.]
MTRRTTLDVDDDLLGQAQYVLGTRGLKDTVDAAFREVIRRSLRERLAARIDSGEGIDRSPELLAQSRPPR